MNLGELDTKTVVTGVIILVTGGFSAFGAYVGSEVFLNDSSNIGDLITAVSEGDAQGIVDNLFGSEENTENADQTDTEQTESVETAETQISLADARQAALDFVGEGEIINSQESNLDAYAFEFEVELSDGTIENVFVANDGSVDLR